MATHFSTPALKILRTEEPRKLKSVGSQRVELDGTYMYSNIRAFLTMPVSLFVGFWGLKIVFASSYMHPRCCKSILGENMTFND